MLVEEHIHVPWCSCGDQRITCNTLFSVSAHLWVPGTGLRSNTCTTYIIQPSHQPWYLITSSLPPSCFLLSSFCLLSCMPVHMCVCMCVYVCICICMHVCLCACVHACVFVCVHRVHRVYMCVCVYRVDNNHGVQPHPRDPHEKKECLLIGLQLTNQPIRLGLLASQQDPKNPPVYNSPVGGLQRVAIKPSQNKVSTLSTEPASQPLFHILQNA